MEHHWGLLVPGTIQQANGRISFFEASRCQRLSSHGQAWGGSTTSEDRQTSSRPKHLFKQALYLGESRLDQFSQSTKCSSPLSLNLNVRKCGILQKLGPLYATKRNISAIVLLGVSQSMNRHLLGLEVRRNPGWSPQQGALYHFLHHHRARWWVWMILCAFSRLLITIGTDSWYDSWY